MTTDEQAVLQALYDAERPFLEMGQFDVWSTPQSIADALPEGNTRRFDATWVRSVLERLWTDRRVLQVPIGTGNYALQDVVLRDRDSFGTGESRLPVEQNDCRGDDPHPFERVAIYATSVGTQYRSRVAEVARLLGRNYQRFKMLPSTGMLRYERRPQKRPEYVVDLGELAKRLSAEIKAGTLSLEPDDTAHKLAANVDRPLLTKATEAVLLALAEMFVSRGQPPCLAPFQERSIVATLCGLYSPGFRTQFDGQVVTAGVGSGKSFAFQIGALIHVAYHALRGLRRVRVLLLYPRVVLAANQFQDLEFLLHRVEQRLGAPIGQPILDAGGQLAELTGGDSGPVKGKLFNAIKDAYQGSNQILISNLDTLANRLVHPEASEGLCKDLDLIVFDEVHLLSGLYGAHARMLLRRLALLRAAWTERRKRPADPFSALLGHLHAVTPAYLIGASATIAEPCQHFARLASREPSRFLHVDVDSPEETGWVHHLFLRQRPEASSMTAATNAVSCLIHNRRDGLHHEYYADGDGGLASLDRLPNPVQPGSVVARPTPLIHKTLGFSDSLDGVNRWADLVLDNERSKSMAMNSSPNPATSGLPYFVRFQEPLWRTVHHLTFGDKTPVWQKRLFAEYGSLCRDCKRGVRRETARVPAGLTQAQRDAIQRLWDINPENGECYLNRLGIASERFDNPLFEPIRAMAQTPQVANLDRCGFFSTGLCWWWSRDHLGNNHPEPATGAQPVSGFKKPQQNAAGKYMPLNAIRTRAFTSKSEFEAGNSINDIFRASPVRLFRDRGFADTLGENCSFVIGSPRIEVGVDLARVSDGITFRAMRDPASLQQKVGRVGRERQSDSVLVHVVTENTRDHFYARNPRIALDPDYLQPIPLHEGNLIVARNHFFMGLFDFLVLMGADPAADRIADDGDRIALINDHKNKDSFSGWDRKVQAVYRFLFSADPSSAGHRACASRYLELLGARPGDIECAGHDASLAPADAPLSREAGALDVLRHEFGPKFLLTPLPFKGKAVTLAELCATRFSPPFKDVPGLPRHSDFLRALPQDEPLQKRSYLFQLLTQPLFRRGIPLAKGLPGNQPYLWTPNFFEAVGKEYIRIFDQGPNWQKDLAYETYGLALSLLPPGTVSYRYKEVPQKVPVNRCGAVGVNVEVPQLAGVRLDTTNAEFFEPANCPDLTDADLPVEFGSEGTPVPVVRQRQIGLTPASSEPLITSEGLLADGDERAATGDQGIFSLPTPPRCFALRWYRITSSDSGASSIACRVAERFRSPGGTALPPLALPPVSQLFRSITIDRQMAVTEFVWGLDRHFMTRQVEAARLIYRDADPQNSRRVALGHHFETVGMKFDIDFGSGSRLGGFIDEVLSRESSPAFQALLAHALHEFLAESATNAPTQGTGWWVQRSRPSTFTVRTLKTIIWFHLLENWHPAPNTNSRPTTPPNFSLDDVVGCFTPGHSRYIDDARFERVCRWVAGIQNLTAADDRLDTLLGYRENFQSAVENRAGLDHSLLRRTARDLLLNGLGITLQSTALRVTGAEDRDLSYFYKVANDTDASIFLFDSDETGNGTIDLVARNFYVSPVERLLTARLRALGGQADPLPTIDFMDALEDALQECDTSQAAHLAFHGTVASAKALEGLESARKGERQIAGPVFDFICNGLGAPSFDYTLLLQACPEFLAHVSAYPCHSAPLVPSPLYPNFQSLEAAMGFCVDGCVSCVVAPEQNLHGPLSAKDSVSKILLDALYRTQVCERGDEFTKLFYPGAQVARTELHNSLAIRVAENLGRSPSQFPPFTIDLKVGSKSVPLTVVRATSVGPWARVFRPTWDPAPAPTDRVRPRMPL
ncbi:DEAD/DEAH box helicase family protein [Anaeromyxobacter paludicola]|uniref:Helicase ATP-binding domain-containing protein n=1 Tax=Anaeromyxobacter paludicola TaxID=2918171 RepID=A0ABN6N635_9BACT|nr:DEAD/DEAH box helicase family protein [Anaeromyxobacter paludicola]BDG08615.1 hypothetical protein AMPC_17280 [Anaeromyxobacter paludicola]